MHVWRTDSIKTRSTLGGRRSFNQRSFKTGRGTKVNQEEESLPQ